MLGLSKCNGIQDQGLLPAEFQLNPLTLKSLRIMYCKGLGDDGLAVIGRCCPSLEHLNLSGLVDVTDEAVMMILQGSGRKLVSLNLSGCVKISNLSICAVAKYCAEHLMSLVLDGCRNVGDESLQLVAVECKSLEELDVSQTSITDDGVRTLVEARGPCLQNLTLSGCNFLTDRSLSLIGQSCPFLGALNLKHCPQLTHVALNNLESRLMDCELLYC
jgi:EIN3-binding F-box protein